MALVDPFGQPETQGAVVDPFQNNGPIHDMANVGRQGVQFAKDTGNWLLDKLAYLDRPREALAVGAREAYKEFAKPEIPGMEGDQPLVDPIISKFIEGAKKGWKGEDHASTQQLLSDPFVQANPKTSMAIGFAGDVATDPLTYTTFGVVPALKTVGRALKEIPINNSALTKALNINFGDLGVAKDLEGKYRDLVASQTEDILAASKEYQKRLELVSKDTGIPIEDLKSRITNQVESPTSTYPAVEQEASALRDKNAAQLAKEQDLGVKIGEEKNYFPHVLTPEARQAIDRENAKDFFRINNPQHASTKQRQLEGTVAEINAKNLYGTNKFFTDDPVIAQTVRDVRHAQAVGTANFLKDVAEKLGKTADAPDHFVESNHIPGVKFDPEVAKVIDKTYQKITNPEELGTFLKQYDQVQNWWKAWSLGARPAYHARNVAGNIWNNYLADVSPLAYKDATKLQALATKGTITGSIAGKSAKEIFEAAKERGVVGGQYHSDIVDETTKMVEGNAKPFSPSQLVTPTRDNAVLKAGFAVGKSLENNARLAHFIDRVKKGDSYDDAAMSVKKYLFDYGDLSDFEKTVLKRVMPFYTWTRKNIPLQVEAMLTTPDKFNKVNIARNQIQQQNEPPDQQNVPQYLKDAGPVYIGKDQALTLSGYLPFMDVNKLTQPLDSLSSMVSPIIKEPLEQATNYDTFTKKPIQRFDNETTDFMGVKMPVRLAHVANNLVMLNELDRANPGMIFGDKANNKRSYGLNKEFSLGDFAVGTTREARNDLPSELRTGQYLLGIRPYTVDQEQAKLINSIQFRKDVMLLKSYVRNASRKNNTREEQEALDALQKRIDQFEQSK